MLGSLVMEDGSKIKDFKNAMYGTNLTPIAASKVQVYFNKIKLNNSDEYVPKHTSTNNRLLVYESLGKRQCFYFVIVASI